MSTYYYFFCNNCQRRGGFLTRQAWGWGNFNIIDTFKFISYHSEKCGHKNIRIISEHDSEYEFDNIGIEEIEYYREAEGIFPHSDDWEYMEKNELTTIELDKKWTEQKIEEHINDNRRKLRGEIVHMEIQNKKRGSHYLAVFRMSNNEKIRIIGGDSFGIPVVNKQYEIIVEGTKISVDDSDDIFLVESIRQL